jgi:hypothetical protein
MPSIFVSYRRTDAPGHAGRLYDRLADRFGETDVFKDLESMEPGDDFVRVIEETVAGCDALLAVIGRGWLEAKQGARRRLDDPQDWVRLEIANALEREVWVIPVLVEGATMPSAADLPDDLRALARRHATELSESAWKAQVGQLIDALDRAAAASQPARMLAQLSHGDSVWAVAFSPSGRRLVTGSSDRHAHVWDIDSGGELASLKHRGPVRGVAFSPDGDRLATASESYGAVWAVR